MVELRQDDEPMDLRTLVDVLWARRAWIAACVVSVIAAFACIAFLTKPVYRASVVFISSSDSQRGFGGSLGSALDSLGGLASQAGINLSDSDTATEESLAVLKSRKLTLTFINDLGLMPKLYASKWDTAAKRWQVPVERQPTPAQAYAHFDQDIRTIIRDKKTGLVTLQIDWVDRYEAAAWANDLVKRVNAEMRSRAIAKAQASVGFLENELRVTTDIGTRDAINRLIESQVKQRMVANVTPDYAFRVVDEATAPDLNDPIKPRKFMLLGVSPLVGLALGMASVLLYRALRSALRPRAHRAVVD